MNIQEQRVGWTRDLLISANNQLEGIYNQQHDPCVALLISRNYHLLLGQYKNRNERSEWQEKAKTWQSKYRQARTSKLFSLFYDGI